MTRHTESIHLVRKKTQVCFQRLIIHKWLISWCEKVVYKPSSMNKKKGACISPWFYMWCRLITWSKAITTAHEHPPYHRWYGQKLAFVTPQPLTSFSSIGPPRSGTLTHVLLVFKYFISDLISKKIFELKCNHKSITLSPITILLPTYIAIVSYKTETRF